jgi:hypothetical protein
MCLIMRTSHLGCIAAVFAMLSAATIARAADALAARQLERAALAAYAQKDRPTFLAKMTEAVGLRPDHPRFLFHLAAAQAVNGQPGNAIGTLGLIADLGVSWRIPREEEFDPLWERPDFQRVLARLSENQHHAIGAGDLHSRCPG